MNKKILTILGTSIISVSLSTQVALAYDQKIEDTTQVNYTSRANASADQIINFAKQQLGKPYVWGTSGPNTFDCSGFIYYVFLHNGYSISRTSVEGYWGNSNIKKVSTPSPGDLIFFKGTYGETNHPSHIGIMINDTQFIHAANERDDVTITNINNPYWRSHILGYGRIIPEQANKQPVYRIETGGFSKERAESGVQFLKEHFGWESSIKDSKADNKYRIEAGGFSRKDAESGVQFLKEHFGWESSIKDIKPDNKYRIEAGGFSKERAEAGVQFLKEHFDWQSHIEPIVDRPNEYKIVTGIFVGEDGVKDAQRRLSADTGWWNTYVADDSNEYKIVTGIFVGEDGVKDAQRRLSADTGWWNTYVADDSNEYKIVTGIFVGEDGVKDAQRRLSADTGWWNTYVFTGEYR
ncbi:C40 family peptidase [Paraclostridium sordellii]|uniref:C40 family peptidase n=1 Tax=Paraclostridium sordellii TaxID=1505 RepID=UPI0005E55F51|nr:C40 family peptidase [Paeniclostridium sordellii]CEO20606.1 cell wall-associated hydrolase [[Clostridium] sordellii] [Paeniclostridium sordellii]